MKENVVWRIRANQWFMNLYRGTDLISEIGKGDFRWSERVERMPEEITVKKVFSNTAKGKGSVEKPRKEWVGDVENDLKKMGVRGWRKIAKERDA